MVEEEVRVRVGAESEGEEVYERHVAGVSRISSEARRSIVAFGDARKELFQYRIGLMAMNSALSTAGMLLSLTGIKNEGLRKTMVALNAAIAIGNTLLLAKALYESRAAMATWAHAIANIAKAGFLAPMVAGLVAAAVIGALAIRGRAMRMAEGGFGVVSRPTLFLAGEAGPEAYSFSPLRGGLPSMTGAVNVNSVNITVVTDDPRRVGQALTEELRKLREVMR